MLIWVWLCLIVSKRLERTDDCCAAPSGTDACSDDRDFYCCKEYYSATREADICLQPGGGGRSRDFPYK